MDVWSSGESYEAFMGRWSRLVASRFRPWLDPPTGARWVDVGCGTGALTEEILGRAAPSSVLGLDPSAPFLTHAARTVRDPRAVVVAGDARALPVADGWADAVVSGLVLNFVPRPTQALAEMRRVCRRGGVVAAYVWDYTGGMQLISRFWTAAQELDPAARAESEDVRFAFCRPEPLWAMFGAAGLVDAEVEAIVVPTVFRSFGELWSPFLRGTGPAPAYVASLPEAGRADLAGLLRTRLPTEDDGSIRLTARAWAVRAGVG